jgi:hypothetical protein
MALSIATEIPEHYKRAFSDSMNHTVQQEKRKLGDKITVKDFNGKEKVWTDLEELAFVQRGRLQNSTPTEVQAHKRKMTKTEFKCQVIFDRADNDFLAELGRPDSEVKQAMMFAWNRQIDQDTAIAATATVYGGVEPYTTAIDLPSTQAVAVNYVKTGGTPANSGLTPQKIIRAAAILEENEIDLMERECCIAINPKAKQDLMSYVETSPNEVWANMITAWLEGKDKKLFGFYPVLTNNLVTDTSTDIDTVIAYEKARGIWMASDKLECKMDVRADLDHAVQISAYGQAAFMRRYEKTVVEIACDRTP